MTHSKKIIIPTNPTTRNKLCSAGLIKKSIQETDQKKLRFSCAGVMAWHRAINGIISDVAKSSCTLLNSWS